MALSVTQAVTKFLWDSNERIESKVRMKKIAIVAVLTILAVVFAGVRTQNWWHQETIKGHHVSISPITTWGFYSLQYETDLACPSSETDCNQVGIVHQYGPICDEWGYRAP